MATPWLSVVVPTVGRATLAATLQSIRTQARPAIVEILVVLDTYHSAATAMRAHVQQLCAHAQARYVEYNGGIACYGHPQRNYGQTVARGRYIAYLQDDDIWLPHAWRAIARSIARDPYCPRLFRCDTWQCGVIWRDPALRIGNIDANCIVTPNVPEHVGVWQNRYEGDFDFIQETCNLWQQVVWEPTIIAQGRPHERHA